MAKTTKLYEFLARFNEDGALQGYHVQTITKHYDDEDGSLIAAKVSGALNVAQATAAGFPLNVVLAALNSEAVMQRDAALAEKAAAEADASSARQLASERQATIDEMAKARESDAVAAQQRVDSLQASIDELTRARAADKAAADQAAQEAAATIAALRAQIAILTPPAPAGEPA